MFLQGLEDLLSFVGILVFVVDHQQGGGLRLLHVVDQVFKVLQLLGLLDHNHLVGGHHGVAFGRIDHLSGITLLPVNDGLVETLLGLGEYIGGDILGDQVDVVGFLTMKEVNGFERPASSDRSISCS